MKVLVEALVFDGPTVVFRGRTRGKPVRYVVDRRIIGRAVSPGEVWHVSGKAEGHEKYGNQVRVTAATLGRPSGNLIIQTIAHSTTFPGLGPVRAQKLWNVLGERIYDILDARDSEPFVSIVGADLADVLVRGWATMTTAAETYRWIARHGIPTSLARKIIQIYSHVPIPPSASVRSGREVIWHLEDDPFRLLAFASWKRVDEAARQLGVAHDDPRRLAGAAEAILAKRLVQGHTWSSEIGLVNEVRRLLDSTSSVARAALVEAVRRAGVVNHAGGYQGRGAWAMERYVHELLGTLAAGRFQAEQLGLMRAPNRPEVESILDRHSIALTSEQRGAVWTAVASPVSTLCGGPGVGKTTVLKAVYDVAAHFHIPVFQAALAGRAARRIEEATGRPASTIAALIRKLEVDEVDSEGALIVIDEASMVDLATMWRLLRALKAGFRLLLVGDPGQLPPISFGLVFHALVHDERIPSSKLTVVQRQAATSGIPSVCDDIRHGRIPILSAVASSGQVSFVQCADSAISDNVVDIVSSFGGVDAAQIIGATKRGPGGVVELNGRFHSLMAPGRRELVARFFEGEPVIALHNDYDLDVANGELGVAADVSPASGLVVNFGGQLKELPLTYLQQNLELAYAITCHKSQGSQFKRVIVPITQNRLLDRTLLLTAVSRAQEQVILVGDRDAFDRAVLAPSRPSMREVGLGRHP